ncbi:MAG TPA: hypothetical protein VJV03_05065 [Pyrinomonadaceae bacterium]|nr:hypothetical protein [Pyrinomonadaceae bacterium]
MNRNVVAFTIGLLVPFSTFCLYQPALAQAKDPIAAIRQQYAAINKRSPRYRKVNKELSGFSLEGGELFAYFDGPAIVKIVARHFGESGNTVEEYYYWNGQLIFAFEKVSRYNRPLSGRVVSAVENRFYFNDGNLIRWIGEKGKEAPVSEAYRLKEKVFLENSNTFVIGARSTKPVIESQP